MLLKIDILKDSGIKYDWKTMYVAFYLDFIDGSVISDYATEVMAYESYVENEFICELAWEGESLLKEQILEKMLIILGIEEVHKGSDNWNQELRKLRFCMLKFLRDTVTNKKELLDKVSEIYADVGYPIEMEDFISYMPSKYGYNPANHSVEENNERMVMLLDKFLEKEKIILS